MDHFDLEFCKVGYFEDRVLVGNATAVLSMSCDYKPPEHPGRSHLKCRQQTLYVDTDRIKKYENRGFKVRGFEPIEVEGVSEHPRDCKCNSVPGVR